MMFNQEQKNELLTLARNSIMAKFTREAVIYPDDPAYRVLRGVFVTLHKKGELRGCIGYIKGYKELVPSILEMSKAAAFDDPRFPSVKADEMKDIMIEISVLSEMTLVQSTEEIVIGRDGFYLNHRYGNGLLLPQVPVEWHWDLPTYLNQICYKAGLPIGSWKDENAKLYTFSAELFSEGEENSD
jgi:AmmeMemoRadiSam system protein A